MMNKISFLLLFLLTLTFNLTNAKAWAFEHFNPTKRWLTLTSDHFVITYEENSAKDAEDTLAKAEAFLPQLTEFLNWRPEAKIELVISPQTDLANGYATPIPFNRSVLFDAFPNRTNSLQDYGDWMELLIVHELTHIVHLDKAQGWALFPRSIFGRNIFTFANLFQPTWFKEGLATYIETSWSNGIGRGQSAYFDMMMRQEISSGLLPLGKAQQRSRDWPLNKDYLYGVYFYQFLDEVYGAKSIHDYIHTFSGQLIPFMVDRPVRRHTGASNLEQLWREFEVWLTARFETQISSIATNTSPQAELISNSGYLNNSPYVDSSGNTYFIQHDDFQSPKIAKVGPNGEHTHLTRAKYSSHIFAADSTALWYLQETRCEHNTLSIEVYRYDFAKDANERLTQCRHVVAAALNKERLITIQKQADGFGLFLNQIADAENEASVTSTEKLASFEKGENISNPLWLNESEIVYLRKKVNENWHIEHFDINTRTASTLLQLEQNHIFEVSKGPSNTLILTTDIGARIELWEFDLSDMRESENLTQQKPLRPLTSVLGGSTSGQYDATTNSLVYRAYGRDGWNIAKTTYPSTYPTTFTKLNPKKPGTGFEAKYSMNAPIPPIEAKQDSYNALSTVYPRSWFFGFSGDDAQTSAFITINGRDTLNFHNWALIAGRDFDNDLNLFSGSYTLYNHFTALYTREYAYTLGSASGLPQFVDKPRFIETQERFAGIVHSTWRTDFSRTLLYAGQSFDEEDSEDQSSLNNDFLRRIKTSGVGFVFDNREAGLYSIAPQWGRTINGSFEHDRVSFSATTIPKQESDGNVWMIDWREYLTLYQAHTLTLRAMTGRADDGADAFNLGESPNLSAFDQALVHQRNYPLRAYPDETPELIGREPRILTAQYNFPIAHIDQGLEGWPIGLYSIDGALFYESGKARKNGDYYKGYGAEIGIGIDIGFGLLPVSTKFGVAVPEQETLRAPDKDPNYYFTLGLGI